MQQAMLEKFRSCGLVTFSPPIVAVNQNSGNPHYEPSETSSAEIRHGDFLLIDLWAKLDKPESVYADYTWVAYLGNVIPEKSSTSGRLSARPAMQAWPSSKQTIRQRRFKDGRSTTSLEATSPNEALAISSSIERVTTLEKMITAPAPTWTAWRPRMSDT